jgi:serine/threonine-protein kinase
MARILVAEDDPELSDQLRLILESDSHAVQVCNDGKQADSVLLNADFDALLLDWDMPGMNGPDVLKRYRTRGGLAPALMLTGKREVENKEMAFEAGADDYLVKPYSLREVKARVQAMLRRTAQMKESMRVAPAPQLADRAPGADPFIGTMFAGKYKLTELLGEGGSGSVYGGLHVALNRPIAVKFMHTYLISRTEARVRFQREAQALSGIKHPNIVEVFDFGIEQGQPYMVLERLHGDSLASMLTDTGPLPLGIAMPIFVQICDAMQCAHDQGILHRDLKPGNVVVTLDNKKAPSIKLLDLGLAKDTKERTSITETGITLGTAEYMSPEQCMGKTIDARSDIYSMGCLMYEVLTGATPFTGTDPMDIFMKHMNEPPAPFASKIADKMKAKRIEALVLRALSKDAKQRQQSFVELKKELPQGWF